MLYESPKPVRDTKITRASMDKISDILEYVCLLSYGLALLLKLNALKQELLCNIS